MSKSRGTFIMARTYLDHLPADYLRYYMAAKLGNGIDDIDLNVDDFRQRVNSDLIGKVINIASRCAKFINDYFDDQLSASCCDTALYQSFVDAGEPIAKLYQNLEYAQAVRHIMQLADQVNQYIDDKKPWVLIKQNDKQQTHDVCSLGLNLFHVLILYLKPILPQTAKRVEEFLNIPEMKWETRSQPLLSHRIRTFQPLLQRIEQTHIDSILDEK